MQQRERRQNFLPAASDCRRWSRPRSVGIIQIYKPGSITEVVKHAKNTPRFSRPPGYFTPGGISSQPRREQWCCTTSKTDVTVFCQTGGRETEGNRKLNRTHWSFFLEFWMNIVFYCMNYCLLVKKIKHRLDEANINTILKNVIKNARWEY